MRETLTRSTFSSSLRAKEINRQLMSACKDHLLQIAEYEKSAEEDASTDE